MAQLPLWGSFMTRSCDEPTHGKSLPTFIVTILSYDITIPINQPVFFTVNVTWKHRSWRPPCISLWVKKKSMSKLYPSVKVFFWYKSSFQIRFVVCLVFLLQTRKIFWRKVQEGYQMPGWLENNPIMEAADSVESSCCKRYPKDPSMYGILKHIFGWFIW